MAENKTLLLVDGSSYLYRAYHALPDLRGPGGVPTGALHGMVGMLRKAVADLQPAHAACVFDAPGRTFRDDWYAEYKATRTAMPDDLARQIEPIHEVVGLLGWPLLMVPGVEADDVIATLARVAAEAGHEVVISTGDKDLAQLVNERVSLINTMSNERLDVAGVQAKFGVAPQRIVDYLTLVGDSVDNIPGVEKVGPKTAARWIAEHGSLDAVIAAADSFKGVAGENLRKALDWLPQARKLVTVRDDCDLAVHIAGWPALDALRLRAIDRERLLELYIRYGFKAWRKELEDALRIIATADDAAVPVSGAVAPAPPIARLAIEKRYETILDLDSLERWAGRLEAAPLAAIDTETDSLDPIRARIVGLSFAVEPGEAAYVPLAHTYAGAPEQLPAEVVLARLKPWLEDERCGKLGQNIKYDTQVFASCGIEVRGYAHDTMLESYVLEAHKPHALDNLASRHLDRSGLSYEDVCGRGAQQIPFAQVEIDRAAQYSCEDAEMCVHVHRTLWPRLEAQPRLREVYAAIEMPMSQLLARIERHGVLIDSELLRRQSHELAERMLALEREAHALAGQPFNLGSPKQIGEILFTKLGLPVKRKTASGVPSTDEDVLAELAEDYPLPARILEHRGLSKLKGTYTDKLPLMVNPDTGRVHSNFAQAVAVTGRLSSNEPNLQNIPIRTEEGRRVRAAFVAPPGHVILSADYSQIELRLMAHISEDPALLRAFSDGVDVHRATAAEVFGVALDEVTSQQRRYAKVINFGLMYGMGAFGLATNLGIEAKAARDYIDRYFSRFAGVKRYMDETKRRAAAQGFVETLFGRQVWLPEIRGGNGPRRTAAERQAINAPMQGTAADLIKLAMLAVQRAIDRERRASAMILQVHDELVFEVPDTEVEWARAELPRIMASVAELKVPLIAEVGVGANWDEAH
jgi:DNA polymerase-1